MQIASKVKLYEQSAEAIGLHIVAGEFKAGAVLPNEGDLGGELGVSRTVIREAIKVLTGKGLVQSHPKTGTRIQPRDHWNLLDSDIMNWEYRGGDPACLLEEITEIRRVIEPEAARLAALRASEDEITTIEQAYQDMELTVDAIADFVEADLRFHQAVLSSCHNERLAQLANLMRQTHRASFQVTTRTSADARSILPLHLAVLRAIKDSDLDASFTAMQTLIDRAQHDLDEAMSPENETRF